MTDLSCTDCVMRCRRSARKERRLFVSRSGKKSEDVGQCGFLFVRKIIQKNLNTNLPAFLGLSFGRATFGLMAAPAESGFKIN